jgi:hypothetical protein
MCGNDIHEKQRVTFLFINMQDDRTGTFTIYDREELWRTLYIPEEILL